MVRGSAGVGALQVSDSFRPVTAAAKILIYTSTLSSRLARRPAEVAPWVSYSASHLPTTFNYLRFLQWRTTQRVVSTNQLSLSDNGRLN